MASQQIRTICQQCYNYCGVSVQVQDGVIKKISGDPEHPLNIGRKTAHVCPKGANAHRYAYSPKRIKYPAKKDGDGTWKRISWDEALETIADHINRTKKEYGAEAFVGIGTETFFDSGIFWRLFLAQIGSPHITVYGDFCGATTQLADVLTVGERFTRYPYGFDVSHSKLIVVIGSNPLISHPNQWTEISDAMEKGTKLIVIDPRYTETASKAEMWIQIKPGTDAAFGLAMMHLIINEGLYDREFVEKWCVGFDELRAHVDGCTAEWAEEITWVPAETIRHVARTYAKSKPASLMRRIGTAHHQNSTQTARIFTILIALTGNIDVPGGNLLIKNYKGFVPPTEYFYSKPEWKALFPKELLAKQFGAEAFPLYSGPEAINKLDSNTATIKAMVQGRAKTCLAIQSNPVCSYPNSKEVSEAFKKLDFFAVASHTYTPTAFLADMLLPLSHWLEDYSLTHNLYSHCISAGMPAIDRIGEAKPATQILSELTEIMLQKGYIDKRYILWDRLEDYYDDRLKGTGLTFLDLLKKGSIGYTYEYKEYEKRGFSTPSGKVELYSELMDKVGIDPLPPHIASDYLSSEELTKEYPLILITGARDRVHYLTKHRELTWARKVAPFPKLQMSPELGESLNIADGDWVHIETPWGTKRCAMKAAYDEKMHPKIVHAPFGWYYPEKEDLGAFESNINAILPNDPPYDPVVGIPTLKPLVCRVKKAEGMEDWDFVEGLNKAFQ